MPAIERSFERMPSAATSSAALREAPDARLTSIRPFAAKFSTDSGAVSLTPTSRAASRSAASNGSFEIICAKGSPSDTAPSKVRKIGRATSLVRLSVISIERIGCASASIRDQMPSCSNMRFAAAAIAEARSSRLPPARGFASITSTPSSGAPLAMATAAASPADPPPAIRMSVSLMTRHSRILSAP